MSSNREMYQGSHLIKGKVALTNLRAAHPINHQIAHPTPRLTAHPTLHPTAHPSIPRVNQHLIREVSPLIDQVEAHPTSLGMMAAVVTLVVVKGPPVGKVPRAPTEGTIDTTVLRPQMKRPGDLI